MERNMDYKELAERKTMAELSYINYLMSESVFGDIYNNILLKMEIPEYEIIQACTPLNDIKSAVMNNTKDFLRDVNLDIKWLDEDYIKRLEHKHPFYAHEVIMKEANNGTIFDIPLVSSPYFSSLIDIYEGTDEDFKDVVFKKIALLYDKEIDDNILEATYFHELTHALITRNWYMITNPLFDEFVPHVMEMIYNYYILGNEERYVKKLLQRMEARTRGNLIFDKKRTYIGMLDRLDFVYSMTLVLSCIAFEKFIEFDNNTKNEMISDIKGMLNGIITVDEFINKYEINMDNDEATRLYKRTVERVKSYNLK